jgi:DNA ligase D-like protein (predicted polymerase)
VAKPKKKTVFELSRGHRLTPITASDVAPDGPIELAWDGHRVLACVLSRQVRIVSADFREWTDPFPTIANAVKKLGNDLVIEGFLCALGEGGLPSFDLLREHVNGKAQRIVFACTDLQRIEGEDLRPLDRPKRRERLRALVADNPAFAFSDELPGPLEAVLKSVKKLGVRGVLVGNCAISTTDEPVVIDRSLSASPKVTNKEKLLYPRDNLAKRDIVAYYDDVAPVILEHMKDRPIIGQRFPDGIDDFTWFQHRMPPRAPDYLRAVWIEGNRRIVAENRDALAWLANQAVLTFHCWPSRCSSLPNPDWVMIDLDPGEGTTWDSMIEVATALRKLLELLELPSVPKTSGQKGLHVLIPIAKGHSVTQANDLGRGIGKMLALACPDIVTIDVNPELRKGRVYIDTLQSYIGKMLVMPYSLRAVDGAPVSAPLMWDEVTRKLDPRSMSLRTMRKRLDKHGDLAAPLLRGTTQIAKAIARL